MMIDDGLIIKTLLVLFLALISPGPDFVMVLRNSLTFGRRAGMASAFGIASGCLISFTLVMCGLKFLFAYPLVKMILSLVCGAYLIYIGFMSLRNKSSHRHLNCEHLASAPLLTYYRNGFFTNILNPKLYTFSAAILTYTEQQHPSVATNAIIVAAQAIMALIWFSCISLAFSHNRVQDAYLARERMLNWLLGLIFIIIGSRIMFG